MVENRFAAAVSAAGRLAQLRGHGIVESEHLLYALSLENVDFIDYLYDIGISDLERLRGDLDRVLAGLPTSFTPATPALSPRLRSIFDRLDSDGILDASSFMGEFLKDDSSIAFKILEQHRNSDEPAELSDFMINLNRLVSSGKADPVIGRDDEIDSAIRTLCRHKKNNPLFVGEAGVGKTAVVMGLAARIVANKVPEPLKDAVIYMVDLGSLIAGTTLRGQFEDRLRGIIDAVKDDKNRILFIDEIHTILGLGGGEEGSDAASILKPFLADGELRVIGATTYAEFRHFNRDRALLRRFNKIDVDEPDESACLAMLEGLRPVYEKFHNIRFDKEVLKGAITLAKRHLSDRFLPDSVVDVIDETGARLAILKQGSEATIKDIAITISKMANVASIAANSDEKAVLRDLNSNLKKRIFGQNSAVDALCEALYSSYAGLNEPNRPVGVFLFSGPSGVGKSELATELAKQLGVHFERFDMSEYMERHAVAKLIGAPPGYVGFDGGGQLTNTVKKHPFSVILFDEVEKADDGLSNIFLQIFDSATLTDGAGNKSSFKNAIIIMTSNLGTKESGITGFKRDDGEKTERAIKRFFSSEFRGRIDKIVEFKRLGRDILEKIVDKEIAALQELAGDINIVLSQMAKDELLRRGASEEYGARDLKRAIKSAILPAISKERLFGELKNGGEVRVDFKKPSGDGDGEFGFSYKAPSAIRQLVRAVAGKKE